MNTIAEAAEDFGISVTFDSTEQNFAIAGFKAGAIWQQSQQPEISPEEVEQGIDALTKVIAEQYKKLQSQQPKEDEAKPKVICLCGSTRFAEWFMVKRWELEKQGIITLGINILPDNYFVEGNSHGAEQEGVKEILDELHKRKIDLSDEVFILNVGGYIGESTRGELNYAKSIGKPIKYLEQ